MPTPRNFDEVAITVITVRVTPAQRLDLERVARANLTTVSGAIREAVDEYTADCQDRVIFGKRKTRPAS